jgi:hypothetical protein
MKSSWFSRLIQRSPRTASTRTGRREARSRPALEALEDRMLLAANLFVVPINVPTDGTHFHSLNSAQLAASSNGDTITIEPGASPDNATVSIGLDNLTIQGDPNAPASILPQYDLSVNANYVTLSNLRLGSVGIALNRNHLTIAKSQLVNFTEDLGIGQAGHNRLTQDVITGAVDLQGDPNIATQDVVDHNTFMSSAPVLLKLKDSWQASIHDNNFTGDGVSAIAIEVLDDSKSVVIANNHINMTGAGVPFAINLSNQGGVGLTATLRANVLHAGPAGKGLYLNVFGVGGSTFQVLAEGNDFRGNLVGVYIDGVVQDAGEIDLGGGGNTSLGTSLGGNDFHGYTGLGGHFAIKLVNTQGIAKVFAMENIFDAGANPTTLVADSFNGGGTGKIDVSSALDPDHAFVQSLYTKLLGRPGNSSEVDGWVKNAFPALGRAGVSNAILHSDEALGRIVDGYYLDYLGRASDAAGRANWVGAIQKGTSLEAVQAGFLASPEYQSHINTDFVQSLYVNILHRTGSSAELAFWNSVLPQLGLAGVAAGFTTSLEHRWDVTAEYYQELLGRAPQAGEAPSLASHVPGGLMAVEAAVLGSDEYYANG